MVAVMFAASASFATPIGYQTNLMVYGPGGYRFSDFFRAGIPLNVIVGIVTVLVIPTAQNQDNSSSSRPQLDGRSVGTCTETEVFAFEVD